MSGVSLDGDLVERLLNEAAKLKPASTWRTQVWDYCQAELLIGSRTRPKEKSMSQPNINGV